MTAREVIPSLALDAAGPPARQARAGPPYMRLDANCHPSVTLPACPNRPTLHGAGQTRQLFCFSGVINANIIPWSKRPTLDCALRVSPRSNPRSNHRAHARPSRPGKEALRLVGRGSRGEPNHQPRNKCLLSLRGSTAGLQEWSFRVCKRRYRAGGSSRRRSSCLRSRRRLKSPPAPAAAAAAKDSICF
jgi:hypothetical protein